MGREDEERLEKRKVEEKEIDKLQFYTDRLTSFDWLGVVLP